MTIETSNAVQDIKIGDKVRSFDFPDRERELTGPRAAYVEGVVSCITEPMEGCQRYAIEVTKDVFRGEEVSPEYARKVIYPPVNGTRIAGSDDVTNGVEKI